jgi:NADPH-dependent ferric siderophore reductase
VNRCRPNRPLRNTNVVETAQLTPYMIRITVEGPELDGFVVGEFTDHYVKCRFGETTRSYTVRGWDADRLRLRIDFVVHGDEGIAGPWAATARPGDTLPLTGPGGGYTPSPDVDWHLMVGDEAVIPGDRRLSRADQPRGAGICSYTPSARSSFPRAAVKPSSTARPMPFYESVATYS